MAFSLPLSPQRLNNNRDHGGGAWRRGDGTPRRCARAVVGPARQAPSPRAGGEPRVKGAALARGARGRGEGSTHVAVAEGLPRTDGGEGAQSCPWG